MPLSNNPLFARLWPVAMLIVAMCSIQSGASLATSLFPVIGATGITSLRLIFAALALLILLRPWRRPVSAKAWRSILIYGAALGFMNFLFYQALQTVPIGIAVAFEFTGPLAVAFFMSRKPLDIFWVILAIAGLAILFSSDSHEGGIDLYGALCALGAGLCWALYILFGQKAGEGNGTQSAALGITISAILVAPIGIIDQGSALLDFSIWPAALAVAILSTALPYTLEMVALPRMPAHTFGTLMSLEPAVAALSGLIFLSQNLANIQWLAIGLIIVASMGTTLTSPKREAIKQATQEAESHP